MIDLADDPDVIDVLKYLRQREVVHFQRFGEALRTVEEKLAEKKFYMNNMPNMNGILGNQNNNSCGCNKPTNNNPSNDCGCDKPKSNDCGCNKQKPNDCGCNK